jgi:hypothetical protein
MTTFSHVGGGIAVATAVQHFVFKEEITPSVLLVGAFLGLLPDLDTVFALALGKWSPGAQMLSHHRYFTHTPLFYLIISGVLWFVLDWKWAILFLLVTWTHLLMDSWSTDDGIMWLWPLNTSQYSFFPIDAHAGGLYGLQFYIRYIKTPRLVLPEIMIAASGAYMIIRFIVLRYFSIR